MIDRVMMKSILLFLPGGVEGRLLTADEEVLDCDTRGT